MKTLMSLLVIITMTAQLNGQDLDPKKEAEKARQEAWAKAQKQKAADQAKVDAQRKAEAEREAAIRKAVEASKKKK